MPDDDVTLRPATRRRPAAPAEPAPEESTPTLADRLLALQEVVEEETGTTEPAATEPEPAASEPEPAASPPSSVGFVGVPLEDTPTEVPELEGEVLAPAPTAAAPDAAAAPVEAVEEAEVPVLEAEVVEPALVKAVAETPIEAPLADVDVDVDVDVEAEAPEAEAPEVEAEAEAPALAPAAPAEMAPATRAPAKKAGTKKAAAAKAPVEKAPVTKAPATKAAAANAPAKKVPAKRAPAKKAAATKAPASKAPAKLAAAVTEGAPTAVPAPGAVRTAPPAVPRSAPAPAVPAREETPQVVPAGSGAGIRALLVGTVLLLAAAVGMGAAAGVLSGATTWTSSADVRLVKSPGGTAVTDLGTYRDAVPGLTTEAQGIAGVPDADLRADLRGRELGTDQVRVTAKAAHADQAERMAAMGAETLVAFVARDQQESVSLPADRIGAVVSGSASNAERTKPSKALAAAAGGLTAGSVLVLGLLLAFRPKKSDE